MGRESQGPAVPQGAAQEACPHPRAGLDPWKDGGARAWGKKGGPSLS